MGRRHRLHLPFAGGSGNRRSTFIFLGENTMSQLINIFLEPGKVFAGLKDKPTFLVPALVVALATSVSAVLYFFSVDPEWFSNYQLQAAAQEMSKAELEQAKQFMPGARILTMVTKKLIAPKIEDVPLTRTLMIQISSPTKPLLMLNGG